MIIDTPDNICIISNGGVDIWGYPTETVENIIKARIFYTMGLEEMTNIKGEKINVTAKIYINGLYNIKETDLIKFTDDFNNEQIKEIQGIKVIKDFSNRILYTKVVV